MLLFLNDLVTASIHGSIVILAVIFLRLVLRKTPKKFICLLWLLAGIRLLMPFAIRSDLSLQPELGSVSQVQWQQAETPAPAQQPDVELPLETVTPEKTPAAAPEANVPKTDELQEIHWRTLIPCIWLSVAGLFLLYTTWSYIRLKLLVREAVKIPGGWECDRIDTAFILGFIRPQIYIPMGLSPAVRRHILAHERTHLEKGDHWFKMVGFIALALHWFNPLVWIAYILLCKDIEMACDERVVQFMELQERKEYSAALLSCSTNRVHFAACPVAFGEVSVKYRIKSVLNYKKPSFWISLLGVLAIMFVAVCLVTSPTEKEELPAVPETTVPATEAAAQIQSTFAADLPEEEILNAITAGIQELCSRESCRAASQNRTVYPARETANLSYTAEIYRYGKDALIWQQMDYGTGVLNPADSEVFYGDLHGRHYGDYWVSQGSRSEDSDVNYWATNYSPEGKTVTAVRIENENTVSYDADWPAVWTDAYGYTGTIWVTFRNDGTIASMSRKYQENPAREEGDAFYHESTLTILEDPDPQATYKIIADQAAQCLTEEEREAFREKRNVMTEIPSNKTDYDQDVTTGIVSRQWEFLDKAWHCRIGSEEVKSTGLRQTFEESGSGHVSFQVEEGFWLETFDGTNWQLLKTPLELAPAESRSITVAWERRDSFTIDWSDSYGQLPEGYYRLGRYYTVTMEDGSTETLPCYCKFHIRSQEVDALLKECELGVAKLVNTSDYYLKTWDYLRNEEFHNRIDADSHDMVEEVWRCGEDYYSEITYRYKSDGTTKAVRSTLLRGGKGYDIHNGEVTPVDWVSGRNFDSWSAYMVLFNPTKLVDVWKDPAGTIHVKESSDFYDGIPFEEQRYSFTEDGTLVWYQRLFYNEAGEEILDFELERYRTAEGETREKIDSIKEE